MFACPEKNDPEKRAAARHFLQQLVANGAGSTRAGFDVDNWNEAGFGLRQEVEKFAIIGDHKTLPAERKQLITELQERAVRYAKLKRTRQEK